MSLPVRAQGFRGSPFSGAVRVYARDTGQLSLLDGRPRSASAAAATNAVLLSVERSDFSSLLHSRPDAAMSVLAVIARRPARVRSCWPAR